MDVSAVLNPEVTLQTKPPPSANGAGNQCGCSKAAGATGGPAGGDSVGAAGGAGDGGVFVSKHFSALQTVEGFLDALTNASRYVLAGMCAVPLAASLRSTAGSGNPPTVSRFFDDAACVSDAVALVLVLFPGMDGCTASRPYRYHFFRHRVWRFRFCIYVCICTIFADIVLPCDDLVQSLLCKVFCDGMGTHCFWLVFRSAVLCFCGLVFLMRSGRSCSHHTLWFILLRCFLRAPRSQA